MRQGSKNVNGSKFRQELLFRTSYVRLRMPRESKGVGDGKPCETDINKSYRF